MVIDGGHHILRQKLAIDSISRREYTPAPSMGMAMYTHEAIGQGIVQRSHGVPADDLGPVEN